MLSQQTGDKSIEVNVNLRLLVAHPNRPSFSFFLGQGLPVPVCGAQPDRTRMTFNTQTPSSRRRPLLSTFIVAGLVAAGSTTALATPAQAADTGCFAADLTVERWQNNRGVVAFTTDKTEEADAAAAGFSPTGDAFAASSTPARGLQPLYSAYRASSGNLAWFLWQGEYESVVSAGWEGDGSIGYISVRPLASCDSEVKITRAVRGSLHSVVMGDVESATAADDGYRLEYSWYAPAATSALGEPTIPEQEPTPAPEPSSPTPEPTPVPPADGDSDGDGQFTIATYPDTQGEVWADSARFIDRSNWLVSQADAIDLRFVMHTGDVVNWDTDTHDQYVVAEAALDPLEDAGIPYQLSIGNHDTLATGIGGSARDSKRTREYQRTTTTFNQFWKPSDYTALAGSFEEGKIDNTYSVFEAEGASWLVLNLELWPRVAAVDWAEQVIASHPNDNVIIQTHSFLNGRGDIDGAGQSLTRWSYGDSSPQYVYDRLVAPHANVKVVTSGHVGGAVSKLVATANGNKVAYILQALHSRSNPVRLSEFDVDAGQISTRVYAPMDGQVWDEKVLTGLSFIR